MHQIATIINYCSNEYRFISHCIKQAKKISKKVIIPICDHFFDGKPEKEEEIFHLFYEFQDCHFIYYPFIPELIPKKIYKSIGSNNFWHSLSRYLAVKQLPEDIEYVLFLDADEIIDSSKFISWLNVFDYQDLDVMKLSNYWYFRECSYQAKTWEDSIVFSKKKRLTKKRLLQKQERNAIYDMQKKKKLRNVLGLDQKPMIHHYSWVRTKQEMLKKVLSWGHREDRDWSSLVENEFANAFTGKDFIHGYEYEKTKPFISLDLMKKPQSMKRSFLHDFPHVKRLSPKELITALWDS